MKKHIFLFCTLFFLMFALNSNAAVPSDAKSFQGHYYKFFNVGCKWSEANAACAALGGHLVTITSQQEQKFCETLFGDLCPKYCWIGAYSNSDGWNWVTGEKWDYTYWGEDQPNDSGGGSYALIECQPDLDPQYTWDDQNDTGNSPDAHWRGAPYYHVTAYFSYICEWDSNAEVTIPSDAKAFGNHHYKFFDKGCKWSEANAACIALGGHLVTITSQEEQDFCASLIGDLCPKYCWIGAYHNSEGWNWVTSEKWDYKYWGEDQPNGSGGGNYGLIECVPGITPKYTWDDQGDTGDSDSAYWRSAPYYHVTAYFSYICEWDSGKKSETETETEETTTPEESTKPTNPDAIGTPYEHYAGEGMAPLSKTETTVSTTITTSTKEEITGATYPLLQARAINVKTNSFKLKWNRMQGATKYVIYGNKCGRKNKYQYITETKKTYYTFKKLKKNTFYKYLVVAVMGDRVISVSTTVHVGMKPKQNPTKIIVNKTKVTLKPSGTGSTFQITSTIKGTTLKQHRRICYETDDRTVAKVTKRGLIKAVGPGTCYIYAYAQDGVKARIKVTVLKK